MRCKNSVCLLGIKPLNESPNKCWCPMTHDWLYRAGRNDHHQELWARIFWLTTNRFTLESLQQITHVTTPKQNKEYQSMTNNENHMWIKNKYQQQLVQFFAMTNLDEKPIRCKNKCQSMPSGGTTLPRGKIVTLSRPPTGNFALQSLQKQDASRLRTKKQKQR